MKILSRVLLALAAFAAVAWLPDLAAGSGATGASTDLGLARQLAQGSALAFAVAFGGGVLTSLTPCVYPLIPITVSIFGAKQSSSKRHALALSGLYVLGIAAMYTGLGIAAALTGKAFGSVMQNPWAIGVVALVFAAMAASMFGAFELQLPPALQSRLSAVGGAGFAGAFAMGLVAGVIAAPCTGPVLAAALAFVAAKGSVAFGAGIMFAYALGMGLLFFLIGAFSLHLPKSGAWMETVKGLFGVALLAAAGIFLKDAFPAARPLFLASRGAALAAAGAAGLGILLGAVQASFGGTAPERLAKALGVALAVSGIVYGVGSAGARAGASAAELHWIRQDEARALALARAEGRPVIIDFWADWCAACRELDHTAWADPGVREEARRFVALKIDATDDTPAVEAVFEKYKVVGMPTVIFIDSHGREMPARITGAISGEEMRQWLRGVDQACVRPMVACATRWRPVE
jgi:thioredoxin:protein disulfide reductase